MTTTTAADSNRPAGTCGRALSTGEPCPDHAARDRVSVVALRTVSGVQIQIQQTDAEGNGSGHRLAGGKHYNQPTTTLAERDLDEDDARAIREMLDAAFPPAPVLHAAQRTFLAFALDLAGDHMASRSNEFDADDRAAMEALRNLAAGPGQQH